MERLRHHNDAWFDRQLAHARECIAQADRIHTPEELARARAELAVLPRERQSRLELGVAVRLNDVLGRTTENEMDPIEMLDRLALMMRGMCMDPEIPSHAKDSLRAAIEDVERVVDEHAA